MADSQAQTTSIVRNFDSKSSAIFTRNYIIILVVLVILGIGTGYLLSRNSSGPTVNTSSSTATSSTAVTKGTVVGANDTSTFKDTAEGKLQTGGIDGEGQYHLVRPGGDSQNVYLTSSTLDLSKFIDHQVKVWGATQTAQHAGWLMDVGKLEVLQ